jgi:hypothetical protein
MISQCRHRSSAEVSHVDKGEHHRICCRVNKTEQKSIDLRGQSLNDVLEDIHPMI